MPKPGEIAAFQGDLLGVFNRFGVGWGPNLAAGRGRNGARTTPEVETLGRARCGEPRRAPATRLRFFPAAMLRLGRGTGERVAGFPPPRLDALGTRHGKEKETRIPEVPQLLIFPFNTGVCFVGSIRHIFIKLNLLIKTVLWCFNKLYHASA